MKFLFSKTAIMLFFALLTTVQKAWARIETVSYIDADGSTKTCQATVLSAGLHITSLGEDNQTRWYVVGGQMERIDITCGSSITIRGDVHLILRDDRTMTINVSNNSDAVILNGKLTIYGQSKGTGTLNIPQSRAGISFERNGDLVINGGNVSVTGSIDGICIRDLTVNGGNVSVTGDGICSRDLTVNGGTVTATGTEYGITAQDYVTINGGSVTATGTECGIAAEYKVTINGGTVNATGTGDSGIYGYDGVIVNGGIVNATSDNDGIYSYEAITLGWTNKTDRITASSYRIYNSDKSVSVKSGQALCDGTDFYSGTVSDFSAIAGKTLSPAYDISLQDNANNDAAISAKYLSGVPQLVTLSGRTLTKDGNWNTLCLPFSLSAEQIASSPLAGATIKEMDSSTSLDDDILTLKFNNAESIEAGKAYLVKWETEGENIVNPVFNGVTVSNAALTESLSGDEKVKFVGQYSPFTIDENNIHEILFIGSGNKIGYSKNPRSLKSCRAHFWVQPNGFSAGARVINIDLGDGVTTRINLVEADDEDASANGIYSLDGRRVKGEPTQKGVYITKGKKVVK